MRRRRLGIAVLLLAVLGTPWAGPEGLRTRAAEAKEKPPPFPEHVVLVILGGGVRAQDMADAALMPTLAAMGAAGRVVTKIDSGAPDAYSAAARILTGRDEKMEAAKLPRPRFPTICEYVRRGLALPTEKVWYVSFEGEDHLHLAYSQDPAYGVAAAPRTAHGIGAFAAPLASFLDVLGRPVPMEPETWSQLRRLRLLSREVRLTRLPRSIDAGLPRAERVERALLRELDRKARLLPELNPRDEQAFRAALTVLEIHRPALTVIRLGEAAQAHASYDAYRKVLAAADAGLARLRRAVAQDKAMVGKTTFLVVADRGRNERPDAQGRLESDDASKQRGRVRLVFEGPGLRRRGRLTGPRSLEDVCPTIGFLLGVKTDAAEGRAWTELLNER